MRRQRGLINSKELIDCNQSQFLLLCLQRLNLLLATTDRSSAKLFRRGWWPKIFSSVDRSRKAKFCCNPPLLSLGGKSYSLAFVASFPLTKFHGRGYDKQ